MKRIESLEEIREYGRKWAELPTKEVRKIPVEDILHLYMAANKFVPELLQHYARLYDFLDYKEGTVRFLRRCGGCCSKEGHIKIDFLEVLFADDTRFRTILLHELCHTEHHNHKVPFWELLDAKLKEVSIIDKDDDSRKNWLKWSGLKDWDDYYLYQQPGGMYENVSVHKQKAIRDKICTEYSHNKIWNMRIEENILKFAEVYRLLYDVSDEIYSNGFYSTALYRERCESSVPQKVRDILVHACTNTQLKTFDDADMTEFLACGSVFEAYTEYADGNVRANDAIKKTEERIRQTGIRHVLMALFVISAKTSSSMPLNDIEVPNELLSADTQVRCVFTEDPDLDKDVFCIHLLLAGS